MIRSLVDSRLQLNTAARRDVLASFLERGLTGKQAETELVVSLYVRLRNCSYEQTSNTCSKGCWK